MKRWILALLAVASLPALAVSQYEIDQAQRSCDTERSSLLRSREGTPSCERVRQLYRQQRLETQAQMAREYNQSQERIAATPQQVIITHQIAPSGGAGYHWNASYGKYCYHNEAGYPVSCK